MFTKINNFISTFPTPTAGLALGISGLTAVWVAVFPILSIPLSFFTILAFFMVFFILMKYILHPKLYLQDVECPTIGGVVPTIAMTLMVVSLSLGKISEILGFGLWLFAVIFHFVSFCFFLFFRFKHLDFKSALPSWFVPPVGIAASAVTVPAMADAQLVQYLLYFAISSLFIILPLMQFRLLFGTIIEEVDLPSIAVLAAPPNLCLAGYLTISKEPQVWLVFFLLSLALIMTATVFISARSIFMSTNRLGLSALSFPAAIGVTALHLTSIFLESKGFNKNLILLINTIKVVEFILATTTIFTILKIYIQHFHTSYFKEKIS